MFRTTTDDGSHFFMMLGLYISILAIGAVIFLLVRWWKERRDFPAAHRRPYAKSLLDRLSGRDAKKKSMPARKTHKNHKR
ncbi:hypothetical protein A3K87_16380 [Variovorax paradoxus]|uniref:Uncharacterized protein n=1 Tax=Variovorax paradoxus TaxID=34073 RepID=A0AA91DQ98_VARPD|nr:hypothetical protein [Variovorax paradoxus]OAK63659.1 hypothetical protein A3K87_16380 [Variovorax paradoxus]